MSKLRTLGIMFSLAFMLLGGVFTPASVSASVQYDVVVPVPQKDRSAGATDSALSKDGDVMRDSRDGDVMRDSKDEGVIRLTIDNGVGLTIDNGVGLTIDNGVGRAQ